MPLYDYQCECGIRFEHSVPFVKRNDPVSCYECGAPAERLMPDTVSGVFVKDVTGMGPQNSGIHSLDAHIDRVIGKSAAQGWAVQEQRVGDKREVLRQNPEATGHDLSQDPDGSWRVLSKEERGFQDRALVINSQAITNLQKKTRPIGRV